MLNSKFIMDIATKYPRESTVYGRYLRDSSTHIVSYTPINGMFKVYMGEDAKNDLMLSEAEINTQFDSLEVTDDSAIFITTKEIEESRTLKALPKLVKVYTSVHDAYWTKNLKVVCFVASIGECKVCDIMLTTGESKDGDKEGLMKAQIKLKSIKTGDEYVLEGDRLSINSITIVYPDNSVSVI